MISDVNFVIDLERDLSYITNCIKTNEKLIKRGNYYEIL